MTNPLWIPSNPEQSNLWLFMQFAGHKHQQTFHSYQELHAWSIAKPDLFWQTVGEFFKLRFTQPATQILDYSDEMISARWFTGAYLNFAEHLLARRDQKIALISINEANQKHSLTYQQLYQAVAQCAAGLKAIGVTKGDRVVAVLPNTTIPIIAMLATTSLGAIWAACSPDFGAQAAFDRLGQLDPKILFICNGHQYQGKQHSAADKIAYFAQTMTSLQQIVICPTIDKPIPCSANSKLIYWHEFLQPATECHFVALPFAHPIYVLFSSGTTGKPKCIMHGAGGTLIQHLKELSLHTDLDAQDNLYFYTTCGWMMWNWMVSALALGTTLTLYEGSPTYPTTERMFTLIEAEQITVFGTSAKFISTLEKNNVQPITHYPLTSLRSILTTGSPLLAQQYDYVYQSIKSKVQLSSISGGTDIISCFALGNPLLPVYRGELQCIGLGMAVEIYDEQGNSVQQQQGELVCTQPFPAMPVQFWGDKNHMLYPKAYFLRFTGVWAHGDYAEITSHGGLIIYGRSDALLNPGGVRIGTAEIYRQIETIPTVLESIVIAQNWQDDVRIVLFVKLKAGLLLDAGLEQQIRQTLRQNASPRHVPAKILQVNDIPRTMNGKIVELAVKQVVHDMPVDNYHSLVNPQALDEFKNRYELATD